MHPALLREYVAIKRNKNRDDGALRMIGRAMQFVVSEGVVDQARKWRREDNLAISGQHAAPVPATSFCPWTEVTLTLANGAACYLLRPHRTESAVLVFVLTSGNCLPLGWFFPGESHFADPDVKPGTKAAHALKAVPENDRAATLSAVAYILAVLNTPGACQVAADRGNQMHRAKVRKATGRAPDAWTNVTLRPGYERAIPVRGKSEGGRTVAAHKRKGHLAWLPSQRQTPKAVYLTHPHCGEHGPGWYVQRDGTTVGDAAAGVRAQRTLVTLPDEPRLVLPSADLDVSDQDRLAALSAAQQAVLIREGAGRSVRLH